MVKKLVTVLLLVSMVFLAGIPFSPLVEAGAIKGGISAQVNPGDPIHPIDVYLVGMTVHYKASITNTTTIGLNMLIDIFDKVSFTAPVLPLASNVFLIPDQVWIYTPYLDHTIVPADLENFTYIYGPTHRVRNTLSANGTQGAYETVELSNTKTVLVVKPSLKIDKVANLQVMPNGELAVVYTVNITNTGDWPLTKNTITDTMFGDISSRFSSTLNVGSSESTEFIQILSNNVTAVYDGTGFNDNNTASASVKFTP